MKGIKKFFEIFWQEEEELCIAAGQGGMRSGKAWWTWKEGVKMKYRC